MEEMDDEQLENEQAYWAGMAEQAAARLPQLRSQLTGQIIRAIKNREDRDRAVHLAKKVFDIEYRVNSPEEYEAGLKEFNEILQRYGANNVIG